MTSSHTASASSPREYYLAAIPSADDARIRAFVASYQQGKCLTVPPDLRGSWLTIFAQRMAALAVREKSVEPIHDALTALVAKGGEDDFYDTTEAIGVLYDACIRVGTDPAEIFQKFRTMTRSKDLQYELKNFPRRKPEERSLEAMGYVTVEEPDGFRYRRRW